MKSSPHTYSDLDRLLYLSSAAEEMLQSGHALRPRVYIGNPPTGPVPFTPDEALDWQMANRSSLWAAVVHAREWGQPAMGWQLADSAWPALRTCNLYAEAHLVHEWGVECARACGDRDAEARMLTSGGLMRLDPGFHDQARQDFENAAELFKVSGNRLGYARTLNYRGLALLGLGDTETASGLFMGSIQECCSLGDFRTAALARLGLVEISIREGRFADAQRDAVCAYGVFNEQRDDLNVARAAINIARAHTGLGDLNEADQYLTEAETVLDSLDSSFDLARTHAARADVAEKHAQYPDDRETNLLRASHFRKTAAETYRALKVPAPY